MNFGAVSDHQHARSYARDRQLVRDAGVKPELEVFELGHLEQAKGLIAEGFVEGAPLIQICLGAPGGAPARPKTMLAMQESAACDAEWSAFGFGAQSFAMVAQATLMGGHVRVGMEDNVYIEEGKFAAGNAELVQHANRIVHDLGGKVASAKTARQMLDLTRVGIWMAQQLAPADLLIRIGKLTTQMMTTGSHMDVALLIDGSGVRRPAGERMPVLDPGTEKTIGWVSLARTVDLDAALSGASRGFSIWRQTAPLQRAKVLAGAAALLRERTDPSRG